jgi:hypothetical protein
MALFRTSAAESFRRCVACGSSAVSSVAHEDVGNARHRWTACCGECRQWRMDVLSRRDTRRLLGWLASDRACIKEALLRCRRTELARELAALGRAR